MKILNLTVLLTYLPFLAFSHVLKEISLINKIKLTVSKVNGIKKEFNFETSEKIKRLNHDDFDVEIITLKNSDNTVDVMAWILKDQSINGNSNKVIISRPKIRTNIGEKAVMETKTTDEKIVLEVLPQYRGL